MSYTQSLFSEGWLSEFLEVKKQELKKEIEGFEADYILNVNITELTESLLSKYSLATPVLIEDKITVDKKEIDVDISQDHNRFIRDRSRPFYIKGTEIKSFIPYKGDEVLFKYQTSRYGPPHPEANVNDNEVIVSIIRTDHNENESKKEVYEKISLIKKWLGWIHREVDPYNNSLKKLITDKIKERQTKFQNDERLLKSLGYKIRKRHGAPTTYAVPLIKKKIKPIPSASRDPSVIEPTVEMKTYDDILNIITNMSLVMERSPTAFKKMDEETLRVHFLVQLNGQYEGEVTGETFNYQGKNRHSC